MVGSVMNYISLAENELEGRMRGYTEGISVRREWRGRGIARGLICKSMAMFKAMNMDEVALTADTQNPTGAMHPIPTRATAPTEPCSSSGNR